MNIQKKVTFQDLLNTTHNLALYLNNIKPNSQKNENNIDEDKSFLTLYSKHNVAVDEKVNHIFDTWIKIVEQNEKIPEISHDENLFNFSTSHSHDSSESESSGSNYSDFQSESDCDDNGDEIKKYKSSLSSSIEDESKEGSQASIELVTLSKSSSELVDWENLTDDAKSSDENSTDGEKEKKEIYSDEDMDDYMKIGSPPLKKSQYVTNSGRYSMILHDIKKKEKKITHNSDLSKKELNDGNTKEQSLDLKRKSFLNELMDTNVSNKKKKF